MFARAARISSRCVVNRTKNKMETTFATHVRLVLCVGVCEEGACLANFDKYCKNMRIKRAA